MAAESFEAWDDAPDALPVLAIEESAVEVLAARPALTRDVDMRWFCTPGLRAIAAAVRAVHARRQVVYVGTVEAELAGREHLTGGPWGRTWLDWWWDADGRDAVRRGLVADASEVICALRTTALRRTLRELLLSAVAQVETGELSQALDDARRAVGVMGREAAREDREQRRSAA